MAAFTASALERIHQCPASAALPQVLDSSEDGRRGHAIHKYLEHRILGMEEKRALALVPEHLWRETCRKIDVHHLLMGLREVRPEVSYALDVGHDTARELGFRLQRAYPTDLPDDVVAGTTDVDATRSDGVPVVADAKSGFREVTACEENMQIMHAARSKQLVTDAEAVEGRIWKIHPNGVVTVDAHLFTRFHLDGFPDMVADDVRRVQAAKKIVAEGGTPEVKTGDGCTYCSAMPACPKYIGLARGALDELDVIDRSIKAMSPAQAGQAWLKAKQFIALGEAIVEGLNAFAERVPLPTSPGYEVRAVGRNRTYFRKQRAIDIMKKRGATQAEIDGCFDAVVEQVHTEVKAR